MSALTILFQIVYSSLMRTREEVYRLLSQAQGDAFISGEEIANTLDLSRAAVWKAVQSLEEEGFSIEKVKHHGYRLRQSDLFNETELSGCMSVPFYYLERADSTNNEARRLVLEGQKAPFAVIAKEQTGGRGRRGRSFVSSDGGVYLSIVVSTHDVKSVERITTAAAVATADVIDALGFSSQIKWVNDIYLDGKKAVGILCEGIVSMEDNAVSQVIIGIGVNYETKVFPEEIEDIVTSLYPEGHPPVSRSLFASRLVNQVLKVLKEDDYLDSYRKKCFILGQQINVIKTDSSRAATALDIDSDAHLIVRYEDGSEETLSSGEVTIRPSQKTL